ncbi:MAG TPA: hypothetical protein VFR34_06355, partial [Paracoccaceae bacterium]|nr:hypothetical protein [Paracoccaceae bacterium]
MRLGKTYKPIVLESGSLVGGIAGGRGWWIAPALVLLMGLVGIGERLAFQFAVETVTRSAVAYQPILTARLIADGPGLAYLRDHCPDERIALPGRHRPHRPSRCYEVFPMVVLEAFREGTPIVARDLGPYPEI